MCVCLCPPQRNYARRSKCNRCQLERPGGAGGAAGGGFSHGHSKPKHPPGVLSKEAVEKSAGMYNPGDWVCAKCL